MLYISNGRSDPSVFNPKIEASAMKFISAYEYAFDPYMEMCDING